MPRDIGSVCPDQGHLSQHHRVITFVRSFVPDRDDAFEPKRHEGLADRRPRRTVLDGLFNEESQGGPWLRL